MTDLKPTCAVMRRSKLKVSQMIGVVLGLLVLAFVSSQIRWAFNQREGNRFRNTLSQLRNFQSVFDSYFLDHDAKWPPLDIPDLLKVLSAAEFDKKRESCFGRNIWGALRPWSVVDGFGNDLKFTLLPDGHVRIASAGPNGIHENGARDDMIRITIYPQDEAKPE